MPEEKSSDIRMKIRKKIEDELSKRGLNPAMLDEFKNFAKAAEQKTNLPEKNIPSAVSIKITSKEFTQPQNSENKISPSAEFDVESLAASDKVVNTSGENYRDAKDEDYWSLGKPKPRAYEKPSFSPESLSLNRVEQTEDEFENSGEKTHELEKIPEKSADNYGKHYVSQTMNPFTTPHELKQHVVTGSYRSRKAKSYSQQSSGSKPVEKSARVRHEDITYELNGVLIHKITVKDWISDTDFYSRFASDAVASHFAKPNIQPEIAANPVSYYSYVPQYSHMTNSQVQFYRWVRENIRLGRYPDCDSAYIMLYIYEIINLEGVIEPQEGASLLVSVWMGYRERYPRLDGYLCEWLADYCMIHNIHLPQELVPMLSEIVPKAQFKEFYLDALIGEGKDTFGTEKFQLAAAALIENSSDYDYTSSRYYPENKDSYKKYLPRAMAEVIRGEFEAKRGIFALDKNYRMTRDSYMGAVVSSAVKKRLDLEFSSFTRRADTRAYVTAIVKYSENKLRQSLGIKAKLGVGELDAADIALIDAFFAPMLPEKAKARRNSEDKYMPEGYLKNYEAESSGFDFSAAAEIERLSWENTQRLTSADGTQYGQENVNETTAFDESHSEEPLSECGFVEGEISSDNFAEMLERVEESEVKAEHTEPEKEAAAFVGDSGEELKPAVQAAIDGEFKKWARENGYYEGELQDRINNLFLDVIGDVILENFTLIEDYREDVEEWMK